MSLLGATAVSSPPPWTQWTAHPDVWLVMLALGLSYVWAIDRHRRRTGSADISRGKIITYFVGVALLWSVSDWPIHDLGEHYLFWVHMVQHTVMTLVVPPLMILGMADWMFRDLFVRREWIYKPARFFTKPLVAALAFNSAIAFTHWPTLVNFALEHHPVHFALHVLIFTTAWLMWMPVFQPLKELPQLSAPINMVYLFLQSIIPTVPGAFFTFAEKPVYRFYAHAPRISSLSAVEDQQLAGVIMKVVGGMFLWGVILVLFFRWAAKEQNASRPNPRIITANTSVIPTQAGIQGLAPNESNGKGIDRSRPASG